jgi:membrane protein YqaA with SNARE-associated domain
MGIMGSRAFVAVLVLSPAWRWLLRFGGPSLIVVGLIDNSVIPIPGGMDVCVVLLTAHHRQWWPYYGSMATAGAVLGGYLTYQLAQKGGKAGLENRIGKRRADKVYKRFEKKKGGFSSVVIGAMLPPPFPMVPVLMAAGVMQYSRRRFLAALSLGRALRFFLLAFLASLYGTAIVGWLGRYYKPLLYVLVSMAGVGSLAALMYFKWYRPTHHQSSGHQKRKAA